MVRSIGLMCAGLGVLPGCYEHDGTDTGGTVTGTTPYTSYEGWHAIDYSEDLAAGEAAAGGYDCSLLWWVAGTPVNPTICDGCEFSFNLRLEFDDWKYSGDNGDVLWCAEYGIDFGFTMAYFTNYYDYGPYVTYYYYGDYIGFAGAEFSADKGALTFTYGFNDYYYGGYYLTYALNGGGTLF